MKLNKKKSASKVSKSSKSTSKAKATKAKTAKANKPQPRKEKKPGEVAVGVRWFYKSEFAKALGKGGTGKGKARRLDVKVWAQKALDAAAVSLMADGGEEAEE